MRWLVWIVVVACSTPRASSVAPRNDAPEVHGMALFGESTVYASHLPMFHAPHDYQVVLELALAKDPRVDRAQLHTFAPAPFVLARAEQIGFEMTIEVFRGHFERGGTSLGTTTARVVRVLRFAPLVAATPRPMQPRFLVFGTASEAWAVHVITTKPDFDQIVRVTVPAGMSVPRESAVGRSATEPLAVGDSVDLVGEPKFSIRVESELYRERADLE
jgi:hypothetical protein